MKNKIILLFLIVLFIINIINSVNSINLKKNQLQFSNNINRLNTGDEEAKVLCTCNDVLGDEWKQKICLKSCDDYCSENQEIKKVCIHRCENSYCSQVGEICDISEETGPAGCIASSNADPENADLVHTNT